MPFMPFMPFMLLSPPLAYIGPHLTLPFVMGGTLIAALVAMFGTLLFPLQALWRRFKPSKFPKRWRGAVGLTALVGLLIGGGIIVMGRTSTVPPGKVVVLGMDGLDPMLVERFMAEGILPHFQQLKEQGSYLRLATTNPALSPVAWASFATGSNPGRHGLFDFLRRDPATYLPELALFDVEESEPWFQLGPVRFPPAGSKMRSPRRGTPFWTLTSAKRIPTVILRVPMTFPPDRIHGRMLAGLGVPDLRGTQGTFSFYTTDPDGADKAMGGEIVPVTFSSDTITTHLIGPRNTLKRGQPDVTVPFTIQVHTDNPHVTIHLQGGEPFSLELGEWSPWKRVDFALNRWTHVPGICRFYLKQVEPHMELYVSPINFDPHKPAFPISHPSDYAKELAEEIGLYHTVGQAEDTWSLNEGRVSDEAFLAQCDQVIREREAMLMHELERFEHGLFVTVFDTPDRIQHMFWRYEDPEHPLYDREQAERHREVFSRLYRSMDRILGKVMAHVDKETTLIVLSDHGFSQFRQAVHLNRWLVEEGFMTLKPAAADGSKASSEFFGNVDWSRTKAYAVGLAGLYVNLQGRERFGIVSPGQEQQQLVAELSERLVTRLIDPETGKPVMRRMFRREEIYAGPYAERAPDLVVGFEPGYRASWQTALGSVPETVMEPNRKRWSGDHCVDPTLVPGVLFTNRPITAQQPRIIDIAPTILKLFAIEPPASVDGRSLL